MRNSVQEAPANISQWQRLGTLASNALATEARLTPKPALVDGRGSGAHHDLTLEAMLNSAAALEPFFQDMARLASGAQPNISLREELAECGRQAEKAMFNATGGSNSHRGAIWCLGLLVAATAIHQAEAPAEDIAETAATLASFSDRNITIDDESHGRLVQRVYKVNGARGEAQSGFPHVIALGLPYLKHRRKAGAPEDCCRLDTLLAIMSALNDTCLLYRGGLPALNTAKEGAREIIKFGGTNTAYGMTRLFKLDSDLIELEASPGGSADLLAATLFLDSLDLIESTELNESLN